MWFQTRGHQTNHGNSLLRRARLPYLPHVFSKRQYGGCLQLRMLAPKPCLLRFSRCGVPQSVGAPFHGASVRACAQNRCGRAAWLNTTRRERRPFHGLRIGAHAVWASPVSPNAYRHFTLASGLCASTLLRLIHIVPWARQSTMALARMTPPRRLCHSAGVYCVHKSVGFVACQPDQPE